MVGSLLMGEKMGDGAEKERDRVEAALLLLLPSDLSLLFFCFCAMCCESMGGEDKEGREELRGYYGNCGWFFSRRDIPVFQLYCTPRHVAFLFDHLLSLHHAHAVACSCVLSIRPLHANKFGSVFSLSKFLS